MTALRREMLAFAKDVLKARRLTPALERRVLRLVEQLAPARRAKKNVPRHPRPGKLTRKQLVDAVRPIVEVRANGFSEYSGDPFGILEMAPEWDEFYGRRPANVTVEKTWMLTRAEHREKTENRPSREHWDEAFKAHCARHGYPFRRRIQHQPLRRRA